MTQFKKREHVTIWIAGRKLAVLHPDAQRPLDRARAARLGRELDPDKLGIITVSQPEENGIHHIIDGQHRVAGVEMEWGDDQQLPCNVLDCDADDATKAADIFFQINGGRNRKNPPLLALFRVGVTAGYPDKVAINDICEGRGYRVAPESANNVIRAVGAMDWIYRTQGGMALDDVIHMLHSIWGPQHAAVEGRIMKGMATLLFRHGVAMDRKSLVEKVAKKYTPARLIGEATNLKDITSVSAHEAICQLLVQCYDRGRRTKLGDQVIVREMAPTSHAALDLHNGIGSEL